MLSKVLAVTHSKVALAVLGVVLVGGGGSAVAVAATTGHLSTQGVNLASEHANSATPDLHAHTISVEGLLTACSPTTNPTTITVKGSAPTPWTFVVSDQTTKINGDTHTASSHGASSGSNATGAGASSAKGDNSAHAGDNSAHAGDNSAHAGGASSAQGDNSANAGAADAGAADAHAAPTLADLCTSANIGVRDVQVQATKDGTNYDAWKVTLQGPGSANSDGSNSGDSSSHGAGSNGSGSNASGD